MYMNVMEDQIFCSMFLSAVVQISSLCQVFEHYGGHNNLIHALISIDLARITLFCLNLNFLFF